MQTARTKIKSMIARFAIQRRSVQCIGEILSIESNKTKSWIFLLKEDKI